MEDDENVMVKIGNLMVNLAPPKSKVTFKTNLSVKDQSDGISVGKCEATGAKPAVQIYWEDVEGNRVESAEMKSITRGKTTDAISQLRIGKIDKNIHHQESGLYLVEMGASVVCYNRAKTGEKNT